MWIKDFTETQLINSDYILFIDMDFKRKDVVAHIYDPTNENCECEMTLYEGAEAGDGVDVFQRFAKILDAKG